MIMLICMISMRWVFLISLNTASLEGAEGAGASRERVRMSGAIGSK